MYKEGRLFHKPSFLRPKKPCIVLIRGVQLRITTFSPMRTISYSLVKAELNSHSPTYRLAISLSSMDRTVTLFAENIEEFKLWRNAILDAVHWGFHRFYELADFIGRGAFAIVRQGYHRITGELVAVKIIEKSRRTDSDFQYFQREIDIALILQHPNIACVSDLFQSETMLYFVVEYISGGTLQSFIDTHGPVDEAGARTIMMDILTAVKYIHNKGVVHRDLKVCFSTILPHTFHLTETVSRCLLLRARV